jgi:chorismate mutase/prephenate dehydratase
MNATEELKGLRQQIDQLDVQLIDLFQQRLGISEQVAQIKTDANIAIVDRERDHQLLDQAAATVAVNNRAETIAFMRTLFALSKARQNQKLQLSDPVDFPPPVPGPQENVKVAYQGVSGAWSEHGAQQLFPQTQLVNLDYFEDVFAAVKSGQVHYGVLPIENSQTGAIGEVYDLLRRNACYIVSEVWVSIAQCLLAPKGAALSDIREVFSHPEGFSQCRRFLKNKNWELTACRNTAYAAQLVTEHANSKHAAIGSRRAAQVHGLDIIAANIMDNPDNRTRFIAIAANPIYDESSSTTSITFSTVHSSGALCSVLQSFMLAGINLTRIESRPVSSEKYRFFADLQANILSETTLDALRQAAMQCEYFEVLGCYPTIVEARG